MTLRARVALVKRVPPGEGVSYGHTYTTARETDPRAGAARVRRRRARGTRGRPAQCCSRGRRRPIVGRVCMDQFVVDLGDDDRSRPATRSSCSAPATTASPPRRTGPTRLGTINYEIVTSVGAGVPACTRDGHRWPREQHGCGRARRARSRRRLARRRRRGAVGAGERRDDRCADGRSAPRRDGRYRDAAAPLPAEPHVAWSPTTACALLRRGGRPAAGRTPALTVVFVPRLRARPATLALPAARSSPRSTARGAHGVLRPAPPRPLRPRAPRERARSTSSAHDLDAVLARRRPEGPSCWSGTPWAA